MSTLARLLRWDFLVQMRSGFWIAAVFATLPWAALLYSLSNKQANFVLPAMVFLDVSLIGTMFMAGVYFLEKHEGSLQALAITPMRTWQWLTSKVITLSLLGTAMCVILMVVKSNAHTPWGYALVAFLSINVLFTLFGFIIVSPFDNYTSFIVLNSFLFGILNLPSLAFFNIETPLYWLLPSQPSLVLLRGAFNGMPFTHFVGYLGLQIVWIALAYLLCLRQFHRNVSQRKGG